MRVAVIGGGISGLTAAYVLAKEGEEVVVYEKENLVGGGHPITPTVHATALDLGFMSFTSWATDPDVTELFENLGVDMEVSDNSFSVSLDQGQGFEWGTRNGLSSLFAQKKNVLNPWFWKMITEIIKFRDDASLYIQELDNNPDIDRNGTMGHFVQSRGYSELFQKAFLVPICASIWSCSSLIMTFSAYSILSFLRNHNILELLGLPKGLTSKWSSRSYVNKIEKELENRGCQVKMNCEVCSVLTNDEGCVITSKDGLEETYDRCIIAANAPDALKILGKHATHDELRILGAFQYAHSETFLHHGDNLMPKIRAAWGSSNFLGTTNGKACITYWLNNGENISKLGVPFLLTRNPSRKPKDTLCKLSTSHPIPSVAACRASTELNLIQGKRGLWFCGEYQGYGFAEDGVKTGILAANGLIRKHYTFPNKPKCMVPSCLEIGACVLVMRFLHRFIATGCLILLEEGGKILTFEGTRKKSNLKVALRVHSSQFYWKVATEGDLSFADAYVNGDISFVDANEGLLNFLLSNEMFSLFMDETMLYSCPIFQNSGEDLKNAQLRKVHTLIEKARINKDHHILEIGCGWGSVAVEVVKKTGCKYTGITLSKNQLQYVESKAVEAGLQDRIEVHLCDYRQLSINHKYDRIIACEMIEHVGHEYMEEFFKCCESSLAQNGILVLQFTAVADEKYDEWRVSDGFIKEYIFYGGCIPSLNRVISAMAASSRLSVVHLEEIGYHYIDTLRCWRKNILQNQSEIMALGFDEKFIRTWEYYFDYCAAGFKYSILGNYQIVFNRPADVAAFESVPYNHVPSSSK
ncbi:Cyclopropane-fatty-acyl-phospholipid synthase [Perilla frutescens var. frutescens]|nr:Cyclopropane-fatty-acyl-phospholipid synthase [Perilla frutescens var. frutescens]